MNLAATTRSPPAARKFPSGKSSESWKQELNNKEYKCLIDKTYEPPWKGKYLHKFPKRGYFACRGCKKPLFSTQSKFDGGVGWCSFQKCFKNSLCTDEIEYDAEETVVTLARCIHCGIFVGKVYVGEYRTVSNERHSVNSLSIVHVKEDLDEPLEECTLIYVPEVDEKNDSKNNDGIDEETAVAAARMLDFQIKTCPHLDSIIEKMRSLLKYNRAYSFNAAFDGVEFGQLPIPKLVKNNIKSPCRTCVERHTPLHQCRGRDAWVCLSPNCWGIFCSKYIKNHHVDTNHPVVVCPSLATFCYVCDRFVAHDDTKSIIRALHIAKYKATPGSKTPSDKTGAGVLFQLGYAEAETCLCCACQHGKPTKYILDMVPSPSMTTPRHPSYIKKTMESATVGKGGLIDRIKGFIYGAAFGSTIGACASNMTRTQIQGLYGDLLKTKKLSSRHGKLRSKLRKKYLYKTGEWSIAMDYFVSAMSSLVAFGGKVEQKDMAYRLSHAVICGYPAIDKKPNHVSPYMKAVIEGGDVEEYIMDPIRHAKSVYGEFKQFPIADNNEALLRSMILSVIRFTDPDSIARNTKLSVILTQLSMKTLVASCCLNLLIAKLLTLPNLKLDRPAMVRHQINCFNVVCKDSRANSLQDELSKHLFLEEEDGLEPLNLTDPDNCTSAFKSVGVAYAAAHYNGSDFVGAIMDIIEEGGDTMGNAMITGGIIGLKLGYSRLPSHWMQDMKARNWLGEIVENLISVIGLRDE